MRRRVCKVLIGDDDFDFDDIVKDGEDEEEDGEYEYDDNEVLDMVDDDDSEFDYAEYISDYEDEGYGTPCYDSDDEDCKLKDKNIKWPVFDPKTEWDEQEPTVGMLFIDSYELRHCITNYAIAKGREIKFVKMSKSVVLAKCKDGCNWRLYATTKQLDNSMQVKSYHPHHCQKNCILNFKSKLVTSRWLAREYASEIKKNPKWELDKFKAAVLEKHKINVTLSQCSRARQFGCAEIRSVMVDHYARLWDYKEELLRSNPGSTIELEVVENTNPSLPPIFDKFYVCFDALKKGWLAGCRPILGLDGCFLKTFCEGQLLCAVGRDGNNHMFPVAWAVVKSESTATWTWFLKLLNKDIGFDEGHGMTFISDQQKGLSHALTDIFPYAEHRNCARHTYANFRKRFSGVAVQKLFWKASKSSTEPEFLYEMDKIRKSCNAAYKYLKESNPSHWSRAFFSTLSCCDNVDNNLSETFNCTVDVEVVSAEGLANGLNTSADVPSGKRQRKSNKATSADVDVEVISTEGLANGVNTEEGGINIEEQSEIPMNLTAPLQGKVYESDEQINSSTPFLSLLLMDDLNF